jgi:hypothetical protein
MPPIGVISDTQGYVDPRVFELFAGVDHISGVSAAHLAL